MNVGLTRAKCSLWVLGNSESLVRGHFWRKLVEDARARDLYSTGNLREVLAKASSAYPAMNNTDRSMLDVSTHIWQMNGNKDKSASTNDAVPKQVGKGWSKPPLDSERMDGVSYRFEDRYAKKTRVTSEIGSNGNGAHPQQEFSGEQQDVEMSDADASGSGNATPNDIDSRG